MAGIGNPDFVKKTPGILKIVQLVLGIICLSLVAHYSFFSRAEIHCLFRSTCFLLIVSVSFFLGTALMVINGLWSVKGEEQLSQTLFDPLFHITGFIFYFSGSVAALTDVSGIIHGSQRDGLLAAGSFGIINSVVYGVSAYYSYMAFLNE